MRCSPGRSGWSVNSAATAGRMPHPYGAGGQPAEELPRPGAAGSRLRNCRDRCGWAPKGTTRRNRASPRRQARGDRWTLLRLADSHVKIYRLTRPMTGSAGDAEDYVATGPDVRIGDADREAVATRLREHYAQGRLTLEEFNQRLDAAFAATTRSQLSALTRDLPPAATPSAPLPVSAAGARRERAGREHRPGSRARLGFIPMII